MADNTEDNKVENIKDQNSATNSTADSEGRSRQAMKKVELSDLPRTGALEVTVEHNIDKAMKVLKRKLIKEGLFKELKLRRYYEKPSERKKRKQKEALKKLRKEESRQKRNATLLP